MRVVAATNRNLEEEVKHGKFREDLYYRLNVLPIALPPLRARADDIPRLVHYFVDAYNSEFRKRVRRVAPETMKRLQAYGWPGNIRELRNAIERAMLLAEGDELRDKDFPLTTGAAPRLTEGVQLPAHGIDLEQLERSLVVQALERSGWNQTRAASLLGRQSRSDPLSHREVQARARDVSVSVRRIHVEREWRCVSRGSSTIGLDWRVPSSISLTIVRCAAGYDDGGDSRLRDDAQRIELA